MDLKCKPLQSEFRLLGSCVLWVHIESCTYRIRSILVGPLIWQYIKPKMLGSWTSLHTDCCAHKIPINVIMGRNIYVISLPFERKTLVLRHGCFKFNNLRSYHWSVVSYDVTHDSKQKSYLTMDPRAALKLKSLFWLCVTKVESGTWQ